MKQAGPIEEEMLAIACKLAQSDGARVLALKAIEVPLSLPLDVELPEEAERADQAMAHGPLLRPRLQRRDRDPGRAGPGDLDAPWPAWPGSPMPV